MINGTMDRWGPQHQGQAPKRSYSMRWMAWVIIVLAVWGIASGGIYAGNKHHNLIPVIFGVAVLVVLALLGLPATVQRWMLKPLRSRSTRHGPQADVPADPLEAVRAAALRAGGGVHLGAAESQLRFSRSERAVLLLGPPRSGKTSGVIIPTLLSHTGPAVATSTKPDVFRATRLPRAMSGRLWVFDPTGTTSDSPGTSELRWSPVSSSGTWDRALLVARAMTSGIGAGTTDRPHWTNRAQALLAPMLHAAAVHRNDMGTVVGWVMAHNLDEAGILLEDQRCSQLAFSSLLGVFNTEDRERSSIFSAAADALQAYTGEHALAAAQEPNFDPERFVRSQDTIYIHAPAEAQAAAAPIVCGLLAEIRRATYQAHADGELTGRVLFALDEVANIAPLEELPQIASESGGQGLLLLAALQDLSQARGRWGHQADGFLTLFGSKLILTGIADIRTLDAVSVMLGEYDRQVVSDTTQPFTFADFFSGRGQPRARDSRTYSTQRTRLLSPGEIANIPAGKALHLNGVRWELITLTPAHISEPWRTLTSLSDR
jgi:type IV secretory pathway TraG/TraD family ATPase VirD4